MQSFAVMPLSLGHYDLGALLVAAPEPGALDRRTLELCVKLGEQLEQVLHAKVCADEVSSGLVIDNRRAAATSDGYG